MTRELMMLAAAVAASLVALAEMEMVGGYTCTYPISGDMAEIVV